MKMPKTNAVIVSPVAGILERSSTGINSASADPMDVGLAFISP